MANLLVPNGRQTCLLGISAKTLVIARKLTRGGPIVAYREIKNQSMEPFSAAAAAETSHVTPSRRRAVGAGAQPVPDATLGSQAAPIATQPGQDGGKMAVSP